MIACSYVACGVIDSTPRLADGMLPSVRPASSSSSVGGWVASSSSYLRTREVAPRWRLPSPVRSSGTAAPLLGRDSQGRQQVARSRRECGYSRPIEIAVISLTTRLACRLWHGRGPLVETRSGTGLCAPLRPQRHWIANAPLRPPGPRGAVGVRQGSHHRALHATRAIRRGNHLQQRWRRSTVKGTTARLRSAVVRRQSRPPGRRRPAWAV